ncbi:MAG TPA: DUF2845 domain-containing protein [Rhodanobacteraceae bacterium]|nr:DUF2845 domain-containing protein [Rhodanobacteraceae bacterium]
MSAHAAVRCGDRLVDSGDSVVEVRERCGAPYFVDRWSEGAFVRNRHGYVRGFAPLYDAWYYNFGPRQLLQRLLFVGGTLQKAETLGSYGFSAPGPCDFDKLSDGMSSGEVFARCGAPAQPALVDPAADSGDLLYLPDWLQQWVYPGDGAQPTHIVHLANGRVQQVETVR